MKDPKNRVDHILSQLDKAQPALPSEGLIKNMEDVALAFIRKSKGVGKSALLGIAASFAILIFANIYAISHSTVIEESVVDVQSNTDEYNFIPVKSLYQ